MNKLLEACGLPCHVSGAGIVLVMLGLAVFYVTCRIVFM